LSFQSGPTAGVSCSVFQPDWYADPLRPRAFERSGKAIIHPSSLRSDARFATTNRFAFSHAHQRTPWPCAPKALVMSPHPPTSSKPYVGHAVPRRMNDCLTTSFKGAMTQRVRVPVRSTYRGGHSHGRATLNDSMRFPPNTADPIAAFFGYFLCSSKESDCCPAQGRS